MFSKGKRSKSLDRGLNIRRSYDKSKQRSVLAHAQPYVCDGYPNNNQCASQKTGQITPLQKAISYHELKGSSTNIDTDDKWLRQTLQSEENIDRCHDDCEELMEDQDLEFVSDGLNSTINNIDYRSNLKFSKNNSKTKSDWNLFGKYLGNLFSSSKRSKSNVALNVNSRACRSSETLLDVNVGDVGQKIRRPTIIRHSPNVAININNNQAGNSIIHIYDNVFLHQQQQLHNNINNANNNAQHRGRGNNVSFKTQDERHANNMNKSSTGYRRDHEAYHGSLPYSHHPQYRGQTPITLYNELDESVAYIIYERPVSFDMLIASPMLCNSTT